MNENKDSLEDNLPMVNYIMLHRIYDMLTLIANIQSRGEDDDIKIKSNTADRTQGSSYFQGCQSRPFFLLIFVLLNKFCNWKCSL